MAVNIGAIQRALSPNPFCLVATGKADGSTNLMALSWWTFLSNHPATVGVCLSKRGHSGELIRAKGEFALCFVTDALKDAAFRCGTCSGRDQDKAAAFGIALKPAEACSFAVVRDSKAVLECKLVDTKEVGDHIFYIGEVVAASCDPEAKQLYAFDGYGRLDTI